MESRGPCAFIQAHWPVVGNGELRSWCIEIMIDIDIHCVTMMTSSYENIFRVLALCGEMWGEFTGHQLIPLTKGQ